MEVLGLNPHAVLLQAIAFIILIVVLKQFAFAPVLGIIDQRRELVETQLNAMEADRQAMESARADYERRLATIEAEARERIQAAVKEAQTLREQIIGDSRAQGEALIQRAQAEIG